MLVRIASSSVIVVATASTMFLLFRPCASALMIMTGGGEFALTIELALAILGVVVPLAIGLITRRPCLLVTWRFAFVAAVMLAMQWIGPQLGRRELQCFQ